MVKRRTCVCLVLPLLFGLTSAWAANDCQQLTATGNPEYPPYLWRDPDNPAQLIGASADLLKYLADEVGIEIQVVYSGPWPRAQEEVHQGRVDMMAGYFRTDAREQTMDFVSPAFLTTNSVVWVRQGEEMPYSGWADLKGHKGGTLVNNSYGQPFDDYAKAHLHLEAVPSASQAFDKLMHGRNDYLIYEEHPGTALAQSLGIEQAVQALQPPVSSEGLYLALSKASPCNSPALRERLGQLMKTLVCSALPEQLVKRNLARWKRQQNLRLDR